VLEIDQAAIRVKLDGREGRDIAFDIKDYAALDHGYAATVHKAQGVTVEPSFVLATPGMDRHLAYVSMTRHREGVELFVGRDDFQGFATLKERLSRVRLKDFTLDYAHRRGLGLDRENTSHQRRLEAERELERMTEILKSHPELGLGEGNGTQITVHELGQELGCQLPGFEVRAAEREQERTRWLEQLLPGRGRFFRDQQIPEQELYRVARTMVGGVTLERAEHELEQAKERHHLAERELNNHRVQVEYREGLERAFHVLGDLNRETRLSTHG
jgi:hypothetical protein